MTAGSSDPGTGRFASSIFDRFRPLLVEPTEEDVRAYTSRQARDLFVSRARAGVSLALAAGVIAGFLALWWGTPSGYFSPIAYAALAAVLATVLYSVLHPERYSHLIEICFAGAVAICFLAGMWATVEGRIAELHVLVLGLVMGGTVLLPWGPAMQLGVAASALSAILLNHYGVTGELSLSRMPTIVPVALSLLGMSVYGSYELDRRRKNSARHELALSLAQERLIEKNGLLEYRVGQRTAELESMVEELRGFTYTVAHDLRAPLRGIHGFASLLTDRCEDELDETSRLYLLRLSALTVRMGEMLDSVVHLARVAHTGLDLQTISLSQLASETAVELQGTNPQRQVDWVIAEGIEVTADPALLREALSDLFANAWKFTAGREQARIELGIATSSGDSTYYVKDNGTGFSMQHVHHLFHPFSRLHHQDEFEGRGMGLATARAIIQRHGGSMWAHGSPGKGAEFFFTLPKPVSPALRDTGAQDPAAASVFADVSDAGSVTVSSR